jgi:flagellar biosynthesis chaperone FliJ
LACTWRIRHKLMLGMGLVVAIMALLLGGTLYGLASYRAAMGTCVRKLAEMELAEEVKGEIQKLRHPPSQPALQADQINKQIKKVEDALERYCTQLQDTVESGRASNQGKDEYAYVAALRKDMKELAYELKLETEKPRAVFDMDRTDLLESRPSIRRKIDQAETNVGDLISTITGEIKGRT